MRRLNVEITDDQLIALQKLLDHGMRKRVFAVIIDDLIEVLNTGKNFAAAAILQKQIKLRYEAHARPRSVEEELERPNGR